jgi:hypothetical protein
MCIRISFVTSSNETNLVVEEHDPTQITYKSEKKMVIGKKSRTTVLARPNNNLLDWTTLDRQEVAHKHVKVVPQYSKKVRGGSVGD